VAPACRAVSFRIRDRCNFASIDIYIAGAAWPPPAHIAIAIPGRGPTGIDREASNSDLEEALESYKDVAQA
jgi:hypothetical protein